MQRRPSWFVHRDSRSDYNRTRTYKNSEILRNSPTITWCSHGQSDYPGHPRSHGLWDLACWPSTWEAGCQAMIETRELLTCYSKEFHYSQPLLACLILMRRKSSEIMAPLKLSQKMYEFEGLPGHTVACLHKGWLRRRGCWPSANRHHYHHSLYVQNLWDKAQNKSKIQNNANLENTFTYLHIPSHTFTYLHIPSQSTCLAVSSFLSWVITCHHPSISFESP